MALRRRAAGALLLAACTSCAIASRTPADPPVILTGAAGEVLDPSAIAARARWTVLVFFSGECACVTSHEPRLRALEATYRGRGVQFFWVDSESGGSAATDADESRRRGHSFPILRDPGARLAARLGAEYATDSVVLDPRGDVLYRGGIDSDGGMLRDDATPYLKNALDDLLAGRRPRVSEAEGLGCALRKW